MIVFHINDTSSGKHAFTSMMLKQHFRSYHPLSYDVMYPETSMRDMIINIEKLNVYNEDIVIVGSSLGGWFANRIAKTLKCSLVLFNPILNPQEALSTMGSYSAASYVVFGDTRKLANVPTSLLVSIDDEVIDFRKTVELYAPTDASIKYTTGGHLPTDKNSHLLIKEINKFDPDLPILFDITD